MEHLSRQTAFFWVDSAFFTELKSDIFYRRLLRSLSDIYYGHTSHPWAVDIEEILREDEGETEEWHQQTMSNSRVASM